MNAPLTPSGFKKTLDDARHTSDPQVRYAAFDALVAHDAALRQQLKDSVPFSVASAWELECRRLRQQVEELEQQLEPQPHGPQIDRTHEDCLACAQFDIANYKFQLRAENEQVDKLTAQLVAVTKSRDEWKTAWHALTHDSGLQLAAATKDNESLRGVRDHQADMLNDYVAKLQAVEADALRWNTFKRLNNGGSFDMRRFVFDEQGQNGHWVWVDRYDMNSIIDQQAALGEVGHE